MSRGLLRTRSAGVRYLLLTALSACGRVGVELLPEDVPGQSARDGGSDATGPSPDDCALRCENAHGSAICLDGACMIDCEDGYADCDGDSTNGCEANTDTAGSCQVSACSPGYDDCDGTASNGCETALATSTTHCGGCGASCINAHGSTSCGASTCVPVCSAGYGDCDGDAANGCESALDSAANCGMCGRSCPASDGTPVCQAGACGTLCNLTGTFALKLSVPRQLERQHLHRGR